MDKLSWVLALMWTASAYAAPAHTTTKHLKGKVAVDSERFPDLTGKQLARHLESRIKARRVKQQQDGNWSIHFYAIFKKQAVKGPISVIIYDVDDPAEIVDIKSIDNDAKTWSFSNVVLLEEHLGFNKKHTYEIRIGQLFGSKAKVYARGRVTLD